MLARKMPSVVIPIRVYVVIAIAVTAAFYEKQNENEE